MAERGRNWTDKEIRALLAIWSEDKIQRQLLGAIRNAAVFRMILNKLRQRGHLRDTKQCREKIKALKKKYKEAADRLRQSGVGIESEDDLEDHETFIAFGSTFLGSPFSHDNGFLLLAQCYWLQCSLGQCIQHASGTVFLG